jgi:hypothetical protein
MEHAWCARGEAECPIYTSVSYRDLTKGNFQDNFY